MILWPDYFSLPHAMHTFTKSTLSTFSDSSSFNLQLITISHFLFFIFFIFTRHLWASYFSRIQSSQCSQNQTFFKLIIININEWVIISNFNISKRDKSYFFVLLCILQLSSMSLWIPYIYPYHPLSNYIFILFIYKTPYIVLYLYFHQSITTIQSTLLPNKFTTITMSIN